MTHRMSSDDDFTLLVESENLIEIATIRSLLEGHEIPFVVQGEHHGGVGGLFASAVVVPRVLVPQRDLEKAKALLEAVPDLSGTEKETGARLDGSVCPVHEEAAVATCGRCGTFLCARCNSLGNPPMCEECLKAEKPPEKRAANGYVLLGVLVAAVAAAMAWRLLGG